MTEDLEIWTTYHVRTGNIEYPTDETDKSGGSEQRRDIKLTYQPAKDRNEVSVRMYYNDSDYPRHNVSERDRGTGFVDSTVDPASRLDLGYMLDEYGVDSGVARAIRTGKTIEDIRSNDRHVAVEICGPCRTQDPVVFYTLDVFGEVEVELQNQMAQLIAEFQKAGLPRKNAVAIGRILGNSLQEMRRGPETKDLTNPKMRQVGKTKRKQQFKDIDFLEGDPDYRKFKKQLSEDKKEPKQASTVQGDKDPNTTEDSFGVSGGSFVEVESQGEGVEVSLNVVGTHPIMCQDAESGTIIGKKLRANAGQKNAGINFYVEAREDEFILNLAFDLTQLALALEEALLTDEELEQITGLPGGGSTLANAIIDVQLTPNGLCFTKRNGSRTCIPVTTCSNP